MASTSRLAVSVREIDIDFEVFTDRRAGLKARLLDRNVAGKSLVKAVCGVSFDVFQGESVGVIGLNGSGKSTLLAAIAGVLPTTKGEILVADEPRLMGVGSALIGEASGIRNIRLGCLALGMSKPEVDERLDELVAFTELGEAIHRPLNTYSSGMRARVQFVVATALTPQILLIDEALSVGDKDFRQKSQTRVEEIIDGSGTLFMVNHSSDELARFCERGIWLHDGQLVMDGPIAEVISSYQNA